MRFEAAVDYPAPASDVALMLADPQYVQEKVAASRPLSSEQSVTGSPETSFTVETIRKMSTDRIPELYRRFAGSALTLTFTETWGAPGPGGARAGTIALAIAGLPARAKGTTALTPTGPQSCSITYEGEVKVSIPLVGQAIERTAVGVVQQAVEVEHQVALERLAR